MTQAVKFSFKTQTQNSENCVDHDVRPKAVHYGLTENDGWMLKVDGKDNDVQIVHEYTYKSGRKPPPPPNSINDGSIQPISLLEKENDVISISSSSSDDSEFFASLNMGLSKPKTKTW